MKVKKIIAPTMPEAMIKVRKELGADAVILNSKVTHKGGFLGFFKKKNIEVIAALDADPRISNQKELAEKKEIETNNPFLKENDTKNEMVIKEVKELRKWIEKNASVKEMSFPPNYQAVYDLLVDQEVNDQLAKDLVKSVMEPNDAVDLTYNQIKKQLFNKLEEKLKFLPFSGIQYEKRFVHLVGPTGVGKTTTIAKIAANSMLKDGKKVALITTDTYRIAAIEQLKTYSKILDIPLEIAYTIEDYKRAREKFQAYDLVLVDTAGRNFRDPKYVKELGKVVDLNHDLDTYLVLSLTTKSVDLEEIHKQFEQIPIKQLIFTKKDETTTFGSMLNLSLLRSEGIAYITDGQDVPDDIKDISATTICEMLVGDISNE
ncbi:flagellar biosynthesis protein FlhF [Aquibacillus koreensis]|uniref:Flagellar biosynthesis protein FlhF n=1 Tax=Aquibacillus koreensis TaxID=279446 RepID=A0A9X3WPD5_9BACI|nr:flagellar biosynthesis protein FlhF [Aquibacillus koreensis]MCT2534540.1 flagellar biosynthesis protein FlhF [Aquibacillus koreensis]MDC3421866.1 flagellar biosynthesis protein FlhF [Aquibacillus koreensis]